MSIHILLPNLYQIPNKNIVSFSFGWECNQNILDPFMLRSIFKFTDMTKLLVSSYWSIVLLLKKSTEQTLSGNIFLVES